MNLHLLLIPIFLLLMSTLSAQEKLPYSEIPAAPEDYGPGNILSRLIDGLGFRYYWATEGLRPEDLEYRPSKMARSTDETLDHLYGLSLTIVNGSKNLPNIRPLPKEKLSFEEKRKRTLENFAEGSRIIRGMKKKHIKNLKVVFTRGENSSESPYWNMINGMISDAIWHTGQVVSFRRASGNPFNSKVSVFQGKVRE